MKKVIFFSFLLIFFSVPGAAAFEDTVERYDNDFEDVWIASSDSDYAYTRVVYDSTHHTNVIGMYRKSMRINNVNYYGITTIRTRETHNDTKYVSCIVRSATFGGTYTTPPPIYIEFTDENGQTVASVGTTVKPNTKYECIWDTNIRLFENGSEITSKPISWRANTCIQIRVAGEQYRCTISDVHIDDITTSSCIGTSKTITEADQDISFTYSGQLMRSYADQYHISLYSLTNPNNAGLVKKWELPNSPEFGIISDDRADTIGTNFGLYLLEMTRGDDILTDQYFYYDQTSNPSGYPELLFLGESSVKTEIRDENYNGGEIQGGGSAYLYPKIKEDAAYNFTYDILEAPYKIRTELTTVYNNTPINSTTINFSGLSNQNYKISVDGADTGSTNGADTFSHTFSDWSTEKNHIISFAPDYTIAGVWGEVKNSETQQGIKSATVSISGANFSKTLYTDDNGLYYLTKGMEPGKTYTITVSKTGYTTPPPQTAITVDGSTTRQDFYMDKIPGVDGEGLYYSPHNVRFVVTDRYLFERYDANVTISGENTTTETQRTGTDGVCVFKMTENTRYEIVTEYNGMKQTDYISPIEYSYYIILDATKTSLLPTSQFYEMCNITITKNELNSSHAEIAASYSDTGSDTQSVYFTLGKTDGNNTMNALETSPTGNGNMTYTFVVQDYIGEDYVVKVNVDHNKFGNVEKQYGVNFPGSKLPFTGNAIIALCVLIFFVVAMQWGKADAHMGAVLICGLGWWFYYLDIFRKLGDGTNAVIGTGLGLATVYAILSMINRKRDEGGI